MDDIKLEDTRGTLLEFIELFLARRPNLTAEHFGWLAAGDTSLVKRLRDGGDITTRKLDKIKFFMLTNAFKRKETTNGKHQSQKEARQG